VRGHCAASVYVSTSTRGMVTNPDKFPADSCWPSTSQWASLNTSLGGRLITDVPPALPCYPGSAHSAKACAAVNVQLTDQAFISQNPIALSYPTESCPPINATAGSPCTIGYQPSSSCPGGNLSDVPVGSCSIGDQPRYTVNATDVAHVAEGIKFARHHNIRLVVRNTGHDILRR